jgi:hypothetical protein
MELSVRLESADGVAGTAYRKVRTLRGKWDELSGERELWEYN